MGAEKDKRFARRWGMCCWEKHPQDKVQGPFSVSVSRSVVSHSLRPCGLQPARLLCPWNSPGKNSGVGSLSLLQGIFPTQGSNPGLLHCRQILYPLSPQGSPEGQETNAQSSCSLQRGGSAENRGNPENSWIPGGRVGAHRPGGGFGTQGYWLGRGWGAGTSLTKGRCSGSVHFGGHVSRACFSAQVQFHFPFFILLIRK